MAELSRIGVAIDVDLLARFDESIAAQGYTNRSEAFRDLIRDRLIAASVEAPETLVVGTVTLIYDHHSRLLPEKLTDLQHESHQLIISTTHVHLDHHTCLEVVVVKGDSGRVRKLADLLIGTKGVQHGRLVMTAPGAEASHGADAALPKTA
jgi:CopG family nickel-responsive transcriptional regulator